MRALIASAGILLMITSVRSPQIDAARGLEDSVTNDGAKVTVVTSPVPERLAPNEGDAPATHRSIDSFPNRATVSIKGFELCSGWLYGPDIVVTAGHCVSSKTKWADIKAIVV